MWNKSIVCVLLIAATLTESNGFILSNVTAAHNLNHIPLSLKNNAEPMRNQTLMQRHLQEVLGPLMPLINGGTAQRRQDGPLDLPQNNIVQLYEYNYPFLIAAQIDDYTFSCRQSTGELVIIQELAALRTFTQRLLPQYIEFSLHPEPGLWWFVKCVGMETGGSGLDITGVQKPGGDTGIDPNALKSLVG